MRGPMATAPSHPAPEDDATGTAAGPATGTTASPPATTTSSRTTGPRVPARTTAPAHPAGRTASRTAAPSSPHPPRRRAGAPSSEPAWGEPRRPGPARGGSREAVGWVKAHGGAGVTSLAEVLGGTDVGARWPDPSRGEPRRVLLVARTSARGLTSLSQALRVLHEERAPQGIELIAVVLVADAPGRLPLVLLRRIRVLRSAARVLRVPWIPAWRTGRTPKVLPRQFDRLAELVGGELYTEGVAP